jgi:hypothetical protein
MAKLTSLLRIFRPRHGSQTEGEKANDRAWDGRSHRMVDGKGLSPTGAVMDFERDSRSPRK